MSLTTEVYTTPDGLNLHVKYWTTDDPKAVILLSHGFAEHSGRYAHVADALTKAGYIVVAPDLRGHGQSDGEPRAYARHFSLFVDDFKGVWDQVTAAYPDRPVFALGHSMGGLVAVQFALRHQDRLRGLTVSGAALLPGEGIPKIALTAGKIIARIAPKMPLAALDASDVSRDPQVVDRYDSDPFNYRGKARAGIAAEMFASGEDALKRAGTLTLPVLIMHGAEDRLIPARASQLLYDGVSSKDKTLKIYPVLYHEIFNEPEKEMVFADLIAWLDAHV